MRTITITFNDGTVLNALTASKSQDHFQSANRETIEFTFDKDATTFQQLQTLFRGSTAQGFVVHDVTTDDETGEIIDESTTQYDDFTLLMRLVFHNDRVPVDPPEPDPPVNDGDDPEPEPPVYVRVTLFTVKMAQLSELEKLQIEQTAMVQENMDAIVELASIIG